MSFMNDSINIFSFNARGLANRTKRVAIFLWLKAKGRGIFFLQECHCTINQENLWKQDWDGEILFSHGESNSRGVAILISKNVDVTVDSSVSDTEGRFLLLVCRIGSTNYTLINLYAPTADKRLEQNNFGHYVYSKLENYIGHNIILGGDLNMNLDTLSSNYNPSGSTYSDYMVMLLESLNLIDIWRLRNPKTLRYTRRERTRYGYSQSRLDYFLISCHLQSNIKLVDILPSIKSDHSLLQITTMLENEPKRGKSLWKLNTGMLTDPGYISLLKDAIKMPNVMLVTFRIYP